MEGKVRKEKNMYINNIEYWEGKVEVKKGNIGEELVDEYLHKKGVLTYSCKLQGPHTFDRLCIINSQIFIIDVKCKPSRNYYPDSGFDIITYNKYKEIIKENNLDFFIFFVDEKSKQIYGSTLDKLEKSIKVGRKTYPSRENEIIYFPLQNMKKICRISEENSQRIKRYNTRNYSY